jgi:ribosomal protein S18 acetylase RimI-like enzyme
MTQLRAFVEADGQAVVDLVVAAGMFEPDEAAFLAEGALLPDGSGATCLVEDADDGAGLAAVVFWRPEDGADGGWDLTMLAVRPDLQGGGRGTRLVRHVEQVLREQGARLLLVRTSGTAQYDRTRDFYRRLGHVEHARVPDYWSDGDDLVLFGTKLT